MKELLNSYLAWVNKIGVTLILLASFFLFTNLTTELYDTPKFLVLLVITGILLILITVKFAVNNKVVFIRTPLDIPLLLLLVVAIVSTFASPAAFVALLGNQLRIHGSLIALAVYILFYFVLVNGLRNKKEINLILFISTISGAILSVISILAFAGLKLLPAPWSHGINFTTTGSSFSTTAILAMLIPIVSLKLISSQKLTDKLLNSLFLTLFGATIVLTGSLSTWIAALLGFAVTFFLAGGPIRQISHIGQIGQMSRTVQISLIALAVPIVVVILVFILSIVPPMGGAKNPLYAAAKNFPREIDIPFIASWKVAVSAFRDTPFWGSGPSTYSFDYTNYKPIEVNSTKIWNIRFDTSFNEYFQALAQLGGIGLIALISFTALYISSASKVILNAVKDIYSSAVPQNDKTALAVSGLLFFVLLALHTSTLPLMIFGLLILASFYLVNIKDNINPSSWNFNGSIQQNILKIAGNIASSDTSAETIRIEALPSILLTLILALVVGTYYFGGKYAFADYHHRLALNAAAANQVIPAYNELIAAENLNVHSDVYRTDLAQISFSLANAIAQAKGPTESSPSGSLSDQDKQNIQTLLQQSINEGRNATVLSPRSAINWEVLALLYRQIAGVAQNALTFSLDAYGKAIFQDPLNPNLRLAVGGVYYAAASYDSAIRFFTDAINLKPDFANGYYNLSVALRDKGDLTNAQAVAEKLLTLVDVNSADYKAVNDYLTDLKSRIASGTTKGSTITPPAAQTEGSLQQKTLPKVVNVGTPPEKIATPSAVKKPNSTPEPSPTP